MLRGCTERPLLTFAPSTYTVVTAQSQGTIRLNNDGDRSRLNSGRLEIYVYGVWGTVCDDGFGSTEATVACRELGYNGVLFYGYVGYLRYTHTVTFSVLTLALRIFDCGF